MQKINRKFRAALATVAIVALMVSSIQGQQYDSSDSNSVYVPGRSSAFKTSNSKTVYRQVVKVAELPPINISDPSARPLSSSAPVLSPAKSRPDPVALVSYQETDESVALHGHIPEGLSWIEDPVVTFGGWFPFDDQAIDQSRLNRLKESLDELSRQIEARDDVVEETRKVLSRAIEWYHAGQSYLDRIRILRKQIDDLPQTMAQLQKAMNQPFPDPPNQLDKEISLEAHEALLQEQTDRVERLRRETASAETLIAARTDLIKHQATDEQKLTDQLTEARIAVQSHTGHELSSLATLVENQARVVATRIQLRRNTVQSQALVATEKSTFLNRDWLKRQLEHAEATSQRLTTLVAQRRDELIKAEAETARREATDAHPLLRDLAEENAALAEQRELVSKINRANISEQQELDEQLKSIESSQQKLDEHVEAAGYSQAVGLLLRFERTKLPQTSRSQQRISDIESTLPDLKLERLKIDEQLDSLSDQQSRIEQSVAALDQGRVVVSASDLSARASGLLAKKRNYLIELNGEYEAYLNGLAKLQQSHERLLKKTVELRTYIDQHVLWIRSAEPIDSSDIQESIQALQAIGTSPQWQAMVNFLKTRLNGRWLLISILVVGLWLGIGMRKQLDRRLRYVCLRRSEFRVSPLVRSLLLTLFQAALMPALVATLGWLLSSPYETGTIKDSISRGLLTITPQLFIASFVFRLAIRGGLAETQLGWSGEVCGVVRRATSTIARYCLPLIAITIALESLDDGRWIGSLGRLVFITSMLVLTFASFQLLRGVGRAWKTDPNSAHSIWEQTLALWSPLVVGVPIALACVSALGYMYSSVFLGIRLLMTWWLILGVVSFFYLTRRLIDIGHNIIVARRRWRINQDSRFSEVPDDSLSVDNDINNIRTQVTRLLHVTSVAFCLIMAFSFWQDVIPAVKAFDYGLWQVNRTIEQAGPNNTIIVASGLAWVTIGDILRFLTIMMATYVLSRNIPGLLQMVILDRLPLDRGGKYAISIVCRYLVATIGLVLACRMIGFTWTSVQWLVAAMSVGLGFGLQEIFANFVAGIIILLERPIRVGDFVTVNGTSGFVTKIQLRATMIIDYDRRELIVPNKKFITDDVINWTLSDSITRVVLSVGIAYGSDTRLVQSVLLRVARDNQDVLRDPRPEVIFTKFGDSSLDFELRVHITHREKYAEILHQLNMAIDLEFRKQNIDIAFPQQDIHVKGIEPLIRLAAISDRRKAG